MYAQGEGGFGKTAESLFTVPIFPSTTKGKISFIFSLIMVQVEERTAFILKLEIGLIF